MKKLILVILLMALQFGSFSQKTDTIYYDAEWKQVSKKENFEYFRVLRIDKEGKAIGKVRNYYRTGQIEWEGELLSVYPESMNGKAVWFHKNGR